MAQAVALQRAPFGRACLPELTRPHFTDSDRNDPAVAVIQVLALAIFTRLIAPFILRHISTGALPRGGRGVSEGPGAFAVHESVFFFTVI